MKAHLTIPSAVFAALMTSALATASPMLYLLAILTVLTVLFCLGGVLWASSTLQVSADADRETIYRGDDISLQLRIRHRGRIPIAPVALELTTLTGDGQREIRLKNQPGSRAKGSRCSYKPTPLSRSWRKPWAAPARKCRRKRARRCSSSAVASMPSGI